MGRLIPAGTGLAAYKKLNVVVEAEEDRFAIPTDSPSMSAVNEE